MIHKNFFCREIKDILYIQKRYSVDLHSFTDSVKISVCLHNRMFRNCWKLFDETPALEKQFTYNVKVPYDIKRKNLKCLWQMTLILSFEWRGQKTFKLIFCLTLNFILSTIVKHIYNTKKKKIVKNKDFLPEYIKCYEKLFKKIKRIQC